MVDPRLEQEIRETFKKMEEKGWVREVQAADGTLIWEMTDEGRDEFARLQEHSDAD